MVWTLSGVALLGVKGHYFGSLLALKLYKYGGRGSFAGSNTTVGTTALFCYDFCCGTRLQVWGYRVKGQGAKSPLFGSDRSFFLATGQAGLIQIVYC